MGRPDKLPPQTRDTIIELIRKGNYVSVAASAAGVSESTLYSWLQRAKNAKSGKFLEFSESLQKARAEAEVKAVEAVVNSVSKDWKAAMTFLERRSPDRWGRKAIVMKEEKTVGLTEEEHREATRRLEELD